MGYPRDMRDLYDASQREVRELRDYMREIRREYTRAHNGIQTKATAAGRMDRIASRALGDAPLERPYLEPVA